MKSGGSMITLKLNLNKEDTFKFCKSLKYFSLAESLGGVESLICHPATMTHASVDDKTKNLLGIDDALVRLSIGCLLYTSPSPRDISGSRMPSSA